ncbi:hypothetical protein G6M70_04795 [Agrobacterium tumefaciens]|uniref:ApeA N-terminal domain 1-containing protein n=1 Tax=Agrobacterium tumefaciens TaxID=358 RepID=UPI001571DB42|nr:HEPN domain-containing protein [Agrobacterium tumefaciens]NSZ03148.1 hypothetical protein [Agrobacterium tumefaciens]NSZ39763.1 hypothetical protein [Agrobacterium tumefaciens]NTB26721.1 hypothetical protein [Agrobacterium tumefaciens]NTB29954.1 hypothetical protein [Agrobacterium tumefaciens]NTB34330.1 hypothetical protein [Agrobacterium tumefaciens]
MTGTRDLITRVELTGYWWIGEESGRSVAGVFTYNPQEGCRLVLHGDLWDDTTGGTPSMLRGLSSTGDKITLIGCFQLRTKGRSGSFNVVEIACQVALIGNYYPGQSLAFRKSSIRFTHLDDWVFARYIETKRRKNGNVSLTVKRGRQATLKCSTGGYDVSLFAEYSLSSNSSVAELNARTELYVAPKKQQALDWHLTEIECINDLASVFFAAPTSLLSVSLYGETKRSKHFGNQTEKVSVFLFRDAPNLQFRSAYPLMSLKRLQTVSPDILSVWRQARERFREVIDLVGLILGRYHKTAGVGFLLSMQAFEAFDRLVHPEQLVSDAEFKAATDAMVGAIPPNTQKRMREKLKKSIEHANEPSLRNRLKALHIRIAESYAPDAFGFKKSFIEPIVNTRNYLTHYPEELKPHILSEDRMAKETERMCLMLLLAIFEELGVSSLEILRGVFLHNRFRVFVGELEESILKAPEAAGNAQGFGKQGAKVEEGLV